MFTKYWSEASSLKCNWFNWPWMAPINIQMAKHAMMYYVYILLCLSKQNQNQNKKQNRKNKGRSDIHLLPLGCLNFPIKNHYVTLEKRHGTPQYTEFFFKPLFQLSYEIKCHDSCPRENSLMHHWFPFFLRMSRNGKMLWHPWYH